MTSRSRITLRRQRFAVRFSLTAAAAILIGIWALPARAASLAPLTSFGGGDGWLAPGDYPFLGISNNERGLVYGNGHLYLASHSTGNPIGIIDPSTGADLGTLNNTGMTGGTFVVNAAAVGGDGAIYVANLSLQSTTSPYKVYKWETETSAPTVVYSGDAGLAGARVGDTLAASGSGSSTLLVAGFGATPAVAGNNSYTIIDPTAGTATAVAFPGTPPNAGDFRLGITFTDSSHVFGAQGSSLYSYSSFAGAAGTLIASPTIPDPAGATADRLLAYTTISGLPFLAVQSTGDAHVTVYYAADPAAPVWLASGRNVSGTLTVNGNGTGQLAWGDTTVNGDGSVSRTLFGMSTNSGIQAFTFTLEAPPTIAGDYNKNGIVDAADYVIWRNKQNQPAIPAGTGADGSGNGTVGPEDYDYWRARFGNISGSGAGQAASVPEPTAFALFALALVCHIWRRGRRLPSGS